MILQLDEASHRMVQQHASPHTQPACFAGLIIPTHINNLVIPLQHLIIADLLMN